MICSPNNNMCDHFLVYKYILIALYILAYIYTIIFEARHPVRKVTLKFILVSPYYALINLFTPLWYVFYAFGRILGRILML